MAIGGVALQEDVFVPTLSVWEALMFYTQLSLPGDLSMDQRKSRMISVLRTMGLEKVIKTKVGGVLPGGIAVRGVSGGEKRRLSIACGLVANPSILFLDEPTTGQHPSVAHLCLPSSRILLSPSALPHPTAAEKLTWVHCTIRNLEGRQALLMECHGGLPGLG